ncbi:MAG: hypothetical protein KKA55_04765 [Proteobacteria bacterium]|nr:hypothetical protein [Pseudomonadota bacterium]MBU1594829.1 hypothetical protein [Pseudomonadota bacterium]
MFGDGAYSGNVVQGGSVVQPQDYILLGSDIVPAMTGATTSGFTVSLGSPFNASYPGWMAFDGISPASQATTPGNSCSSLATDTWTIQCPEVSNVGGYSVTGTNYPSGYNVDSWTFHGSNDGTNWTLLDSQSGQRSAVTNTRKVFKLPALASYSRYKFVMSDAGCVEVAELELLSGTLLKNALAISGTATVAPDAGTGASAVMCDTLILDGASASLRPSANSKALVVFARTGIQLLNGARLNIDALGRGGNFGNLTAWGLLPDSLRRKLRQAALEAYVVQGEGAAGAAAQPGANTTGYTGSAGAAMQTGGGGSGCHAGGGTDPGGKGGPCSGGAGSTGTPYSASGTRVAPEAYGGKGGWFNGTCAGAAGGGAGDPIGPGTAGVVTPASGAGGGLLMLFTPALSVGSGCIVSSDGGRGGSDAAYGYPGAGAGGGIVCIVTKAGGYTNSGTVRASGGLGGPNYGNNPPCTGGSGGAGSVNIFTAT